MNEIKRKVGIVPNYRAQYLAVNVIEIIEDEGETGERVNPTIRVYPDLEKGIDDEYIEIVKKFFETTYMIEY